MGYLDCKSSDKALFICYYLRMDDVILEVSDTGCRISKSDKEPIFGQPFSAAGPKRSFNFALSVAS